MTTFLLKTALLVTLMLGTVVHSETAAWQDIVVFDCEGNLNIAPSNPLVSMSAKTYFREVAEFANSLFTDYAECHCEDITETDLSANFEWTFENILKGLESDSGFENPAECSGMAAFTHGVPDAFREIMFALPDTCSSSTYADDGCAFEVQFNDASDLKLQVAVSQCPDNGALPYVSLSCSGDECSELMVPCSTDSDCGSGTCMEIFDRKASTECGQWNSYGNGTDYCEWTYEVEATTGTVEAFNGFQEMLEGWLGIASTADDSWGTESCSTEVDDAGERMFNQMMAFARAQMGASTGNVNGTKFCGLDQFLGNEGFFEDSDLLNSCTFLCDGEECPDDDCYDKAWENNTDSSHCEYDQTSVSCTMVTSWDGVLDNAVSVFEETRVEGTPIVPDSFSSDEAETVNLLHLSCDSEVAIMNGLSLGQAIQLPPIHEITQEWGNAIISLAQCQLEGLTEEQCAVRYFVWQPAIWMYHFTTLAGTFNLVDTDLSDLFENLGNEAEDALKFKMACTCTFEEWIENGRCAIEFTGLSGLLGYDVTLRLTAAKCSTDDLENSIPEFFLDCEGAFCEDMFRSYEVEYCTQNSDCDDGVTCVPVDDPFETSLLGRLIGFEVPEYEVQILGFQTCDTSITISAFESALLSDLPLVFALVNDTDVNDDEEIPESFETYSYEDWGDCKQISIRPVLSDMDKWPYHYQNAINVFFNLEDSDRPDLTVLDTDSIASTWDSYERLYNCTEFGGEDLSTEDCETADYDTCDTSSHRIVDLFNFAYHITGRTPEVAIDAASESHGYCQTTVLKRLFAEEDLSDEDEVTIETWAEAQYTISDEDDTVTLHFVNGWQEATEWPLTGGSTAPEKCDDDTNVLDGDDDGTNNPVDNAVSAAFNGVFVLIFLFINL